MPKLNQEFFVFLVEMLSADFFLIENHSPSEFEPFFTALFVLGKWNKKSFERKKCWDSEAVSVIFFRAKAGSRNFFISTHHDTFAVQKQRLSDGYERGEEEAEKKRKLTGKNGKRICYQEKKKIEEIRSSCKASSLGGQRGCTRYLYTSRYIVKEKGC